ncbi:MAG TPA: hypothetical protein VGC96_01935 [Candidatus Elarobacter sp.]
MTARQRPLIGLLAAPALLWCIAAAPEPAAAQAAPAGAEPGALRLLAERLARESAAGPSDIELFPGTIPPLPLAFVPPADARVLGTAVERPRPGGPPGAPRLTRFRVFFSTTSAPQEVVDAIALALSRRGYVRRPRPFGSPVGGFTTASPVTANLCGTASDPRILVRARRNGAVTDAVLEESLRVPEALPAAGAPCDPASGPDPLAALPAIAPAPAIAVVTRFSSLAPDAVLQTADVFTALRARTVLESWVTQAVAAGWALRSSTATDDAALASLVRSGGGHTRMLVIALARAGPGQFYASLTNATSEAEPTGVPAGR